METDSGGTKVYSSGGPAGRDWDILGKKYRDMKNKLTLAAHLLTTGNGLLGAVAARTLEERSSQWAKQVEGYMKDIGVGAANLMSYKILQYYVYYYCPRRG